mmetsp:Transcript_3910/g.12644  ORF Transcript_3910/g.12644 Transcript_3910/m.12644 type:complete len:235 (+) Transcript_3910:218-922(+)
MATSTRGPPHAGGADEERDVSRRRSASRSTPKSSSADQEVDETRSAGMSGRARTWPVPLSKLVHGVPPASQGEERGEEGGPFSSQRGAPPGATSAGLSLRSSSCRCSSGVGRKKAGGRSYSVSARTLQCSRSQPLIAAVTQRWPSSDQPSSASYRRAARTYGCEAPRPPCSRTEKPRLCQSTTTMQPLAARASHAAASVGMAGGVCSSSTSTRGSSSSSAKRSCPSLSSALAGA